MKSKNSKNSALNDNFDKSPNDRIISETLQKSGQQVYSRNATKWGVSQNSNHTHNGSDSNRILYNDLSQKLVIIHWTLPGTSAATATNYGTFWIAPTGCSVILAQEVHQTAGSSGGGVTLNIEKLTGTEAPNGGTEILSEPFDLKGTANTVQNGIITQVRTDGMGAYNLLQGDRLCLKDSGTLTSVSNVTVVVTILIP